jgi:thiamine biosynthesis lipoprotein
MKKICLLLAAVLLISGCGKNAVSTENAESANRETSTSAATTEELTDSDPAVKELFAMDTYMTLTAYGEHGEDAVEAAAEEIDRIEKLVSTGEEDSEISQLNREGKAEVSEDTYELIERSMELGTSTDGAFDITIYPLMQAWGFTDQNFRVPEEAELKGLLKYTGRDKISLDTSTRTVSLMEGTEIDLGGIAKGYTSARIMDIFREYGVTSGIVSLGGNVQALGTKTDGTKWRVAIENPDKEEDYIGILSIEDKAVITSGGYERYFEEDGVTYHHILDPETGYPAESGLTSVTIVSEDGTMADGLSTSLFIMGKEKAVDYWSARSDEFDMILVDDHGKILVTEGIADDFESDNEVEVQYRDGSEDAGK